MINAAAEIKAITPGGMMLPDLYQRKNMIQAKTSKVTGNIAKSWIRFLVVRRQNLLEVEFRHFTQLQCWFGRSLRIQIGTEC